MLGQISPDMMRARAELAPSGRFNDRDRENLRRFRRSRCEGAKRDIAGVWSAKIVTTVSRVFDALRLRGSKA